MESQSIRITLVDKTRTRMNGQTISREINLLVMPNASDEIVLEDGAVFKVVHRSFHESGKITLHGVFSSIQK